MKAELTIKEAVKPVDPRNFILEMDFDVARYLTLLIANIDPTEAFEDADDALNTALVDFRYTLEDRYDFDLSDIINDVR